MFSLFIGYVSGLPLLFSWLSASCQVREHSVQHSFSVNFFCHVFPLLHLLVKLSAASCRSISSLKICL